MPHLRSFNLWGLTVLAAVVAQMDEEMDQRLELVLRGHADPWEGFLAYCRAYLAMAQEAEIRRIVLQDARSVLTGTDLAPQKWSS